MASFNKVILIGHLTADPELKQTPSGVAMTSFSIGVNRRYTKPGEQTQVDFINIVAWRNTAEFITKYFHKGSAILVCGSLQTRSWVDQQGQKRYATDVVADEATFVERKSENNASSGSFAGEQYSAPAPAYSSPTSDVPKFEEMPSDDDLPF